MNRKLHFKNKQFIQTYSNNDIRDIETLKQKYLRYRSKEKHRNDIAKVYEINTHGKFTVIVRSSFIRLHVYPTTTINPCYLLDLSSLCNSEMSVQSNLNLEHDRVRERKRKTWKSFYGKVIKNEVISTLIIDSCMINYAVVDKQVFCLATTQTKHLPIIIEQGHFSYGLFVSLLVICIMIIGLILWYIFIKTSHSHKSTLRLTSEDGDSDGQYQIRRLDNSETDLNSSQTDKTIDSLLSDDINNTNEKINYENMQMLIENLQQSNLESIDSSVIGRILSNLIYQAVSVANNTNLNPQSSIDLQTFLLYAPQFFHILRTIITNKRSCESLNFPQYQYLIDILHNSEFILEYLHQHHSDEREFLVKILTDLYQILSSMDNNSSRHQLICQSLSNILEKLNKQQNSSPE